MAGNRVFIGVIAFDATPGVTCVSADTKMAADQDEGRLTRYEEAEKLVKAHLRGKQAGTRNSSWPGVPMAQWSVYIVRCRDGALYTGISTDVRRRIAEHARNNGRSAKYLRGKGPLRLAFVEVAGTKELALRVERQIKKLPKARKEDLIRQATTVNQMLEPAKSRPLRRGRR